eukprot:g22877.t1
MIFLHFCMHRSEAGTGAYARFQPHGMWAALFWIVVQAGGRRDFAMWSQLQKLLSPGVGIPAEQTLNPDPCSPELVARCRSQNRYACSPGRATCGGCQLGSLPDRQGNCKDWRQPKQDDVVNFLEEQSRAYQGHLSLQKEGQAYADQLYEQLESLFGTDTGLLTMEWPGRVLDEQTYRFHLEDSYSDFLKPMTVKTAEFRLTDDLFPLAQITGGPSGLSLAKTYRLAIGQLVESTEYPQEAFEVEKLNARNFLQQIVPGSNLTLMEHHAQFVQQYNAVRDKWEEILSDLKNDASGAVGQEARTRIASTIVLKNDLAQTEMDNAWRALVVQGYHHEVQSALSLLDVDSPGQLLQEAKDRMRNSGVTSLDGSETIYPVTLQPANWAELMLNSSYQAVDLLMDAEEVLAQVQVLQNQRVQKQDAVTSIKLSQSASGASTSEQAQAALTASVEDYNQKKQALISLLHGDSDLANRYLLVCMGHTCDKEGEVVFTGTWPLQLDPSIAYQLDYSQLKAAVLQAVQAHHSVLSKGQSVSNLDISAAMDHAAMDHSQYTNEVSQLNDEIAKITRQIDALSNAYASVIASRAGGKFDVESEQPFPSMPQPGPWTRVQLRHKATRQSHQSNMVTSSTYDDGRDSTYDMAFNSLHAGYSYSISGQEEESRSETSSASDTQTSATWSASSSLELLIAYEATKVTIDRGGWFRPDFLEHSNLFMKFKEIAISNGRPNHTELSSGSKDERVKVYQHYTNCLLPTYPTAFILVRDVSIKIIDKEAKQHASETTSNSWSVEQKQKRAMQLDAQSDFFGFSHSASASSAIEFATGSQKGYFAEGDENSLVIKIPGPQILMWEQSFIAKDRATLLEGRQPRKTERWALAKPNGWKAPEVLAPQVPASTQQAPTTSATQQQEQPSPLQPTTTKQPELPTTQSQGRKSDDYGKENMAASTPPPSASPSSSPSLSPSSSISGSSSASLAPSSSPTSSISHTPSSSISHSPSSSPSSSSLPSLSASPSSSPSSSSLPSLSATPAVSVSASSSNSISATPTPAAQAANTSDNTDTTTTVQPTTTAGQ